MDDPEMELQPNMTMAYHASCYGEPEVGGAALENTYRITDKRCEALTKSPCEEIMILGILNSFGNEGG